MDATNGTIIISAVVTGQPVLNLVAEQIEIRFYTMYADWKDRAVVGHTRCNSVFIKVSTAVDAGQVVVPLSVISS
jgi:hypothetical protein